MYVSCLLNTISLTFFLGKARIEMDILQSMPNFSQFLQVLRTFVDGGTVVDMGDFSVSAVPGSFTPEEQLGNKMLINLYACERNCNTYKFITFSRFES